MRNACLLLVVSLSAVIAVGQDINTPQWEVYAGYQYTSIDIGVVQDLADSITVPDGLPRVNVGRSLKMNGGDISVQENSASWWGGVVDFSGSYASKHIDLSEAAQAAGLVPPGTSVVAIFRPTVYTVMGGPQFTYRKKENIQPFTRIMLGVARTDLAPDSNPRAVPNTQDVLSALAPAFKTKDTSFAFAIGLGADYVWKRYIAFRVAGDYLRTYLFNEHQGNVRITAGVDFRIGQK
jgi:hypothetical protein